MTKSVGLLNGLQNPFAGVNNLRNSDYCAYVDGRLMHIIDARPVSARSRLLHKAIRSFIGSPHYPCVGAKSVLNRATYRFGSYGRLASPAATAGLAHDLCAFVAEMRSKRHAFCSYIAVFDDLDCREEALFESALWQQLRGLRRLDQLFFPYDDFANSDPASASYAFSFASCAMFVVGLHPGSSRVARRFPWPALVFNPHDQFRALRAGGKYNTFKGVIRAREVKLQGSINPNLSDFGEQSEARQYAGRAVDKDWKCPFVR